MVKYPSCGRSAMSLVPAYVGGFAFLKSKSAPLGGMDHCRGVLAMALEQTFLVPLVRSDS